MKNRLLRRIFIAAATAMMFVQMRPVNVKAEEGPLTGKTATEITAMMGNGWNLGNTLDATGGNKTDIYSHETAWGNPKVTKDLIDGVKAAGFTTIRIPITWADYIDTDNGYEIYPEYMARVKEIVDYAYDSGLFVIINVHHEEWVNRTTIDKKYVEIGEELVAVWKQVSDTFADYDQHLIFEGMNEPRAKGTNYEWTGNKACYEAVNYLDQLFVDTVRQNGKGYNGERMLMVPGYAASSNPSVLKSIKLPEINGETASNICVSVHCYSPYNFCLQDTQTTFDPKNSSDTSDIKTLFGNLKSLFINNGIPVVMGECGATNSGNNDSARLAWFAYMGTQSKEYGIPIVLWDNGVNGTSGGECHYYFYRETGEPYSQDFIDAFLTGVINEKAENTVIDFEAVNDGTHSTIKEPSELGFTTKVFTQIKINHTEGIPMGFSLKVDSDAPDYNAEYDIGRFKGHTLRIGAWVYSEDNATVSVGINSGSSEELVNVSASTEWTEVCFDVDVPESGDSVLYFKGDANFYIDDISIEMDPTEPLDKTEVKEDEPQAEAENSSEASIDSKDTADSSVGNTDSAKSGNSSRTVVAVLIALIVAAVAAVFVKRRKK